MRAKRKKIRIRKSTKYIFIAIAIVLIITSLSDLFRKLSNENMGTETKQIYTYQNKFDYAYKVNLIPNEYITEIENSQGNIAYVTDLIQDMDIELNYQYKAQKESDLNYEYEIIGKTQAMYTKDGEEQKIIEQEEVLLEKQINTKNTDIIDINETLKLDLKDKNDLLNDFKQQMGMSITANYTVILKITVKTNIEEKDIVAEYTPTIIIDLADKTTKITGENNIEDTQYVSKEYKSQEQNPIVFIIDIIAIAVSIYLLRIVSKAKVTNRIKNEFKYELNRILKLCQDKIVQVSTKPDGNRENIVHVKDFGEILKLSEELFKPILYYFDQEKEEAYFSVVSNGVIYRYVLRK